MKTFFLALLSVSLAITACAQREEYIWALVAGLDFNSGSPVVINTRMQGDQNNASVCDASGRLLFYTDGYQVWDRNHNLMPSITATIPYKLLMHWTGGAATQPAAIVPDPADTAKYYLFSLSINGHLYYSKIDMRLNNGLGDIMPGHKSILLDGITRPLASKMTVVKSCSGIWLLVRERDANRYRAYEITRSGISNEPVVSTCGALPAANYIYGVLKASPDGRKLAAACYGGGLELYDFDPFSGAVYNPVVIDSTTTYYGACFSPDNTKLYTTVATFSVIGEVFQFDLSLSVPAAISASKIRVLTNPVYWFYLPLVGWVPQYRELGDLKRGPDGKIYVGDNFGGDRPNLFTGPGSGIRAPVGYHTIDSPDSAGMACGPVISAVRPILRTFRGMPNDVRLAPVQDTVTSRVSIPVCFGDSIILSADAGKHYKWDSGNEHQALAVYRPGSYVVHFTDVNCNYRIDTFIVTFNRHLPSFGAQSFSCPGMKQGSIVLLQPQGDVTTFTYHWENASGAMIRVRENDTGDTISGLDPGKYAVRITTPAGCDTTLYTEVLPLPRPKAAFETDTIVCINERLVFYNTSGAPLWKWYFGDGEASDTDNPEYTYRDTGNYKAMLVAENIERCTDTAYKTIRVNELRLQLIPDKQVAGRKEQIQLWTESTEPYHIITWQPEHLFTDLGAYRQQVMADTTRVYSVIGISGYGCMDTATTTITVHPVVYLPAAFTPNGDGRNDHFRPVSNEPVIVRFFRIYDRWGEEVWSGQGSSINTGWDGTGNGIPAQVGVYYYIIEAETTTGKIIRKKGDVTLLR